MPSRISCLLVLGFTLCLSDARSQTVQPSASAQIASLRADWCKYLHTKQLDREMDLYTSDAVFLQPSSARVSGLPAIRKLFADVMAAITSDPVLTGIDLEVSGDLAYDSGEYDETLTDVATGAKTQAKGAYLMVLKRQKDGRWRIQQQMWSLYP